MESTIPEKQKREKKSGARKKVRTYTGKSITNLVIAQSQEMSSETAYETTASPYKLNMEKKGELASW